MPNVMSRLTSVFRETLDEEDLQLSRETSPHQVDGWDSIANVKLFLALESEFDVDFTPDELAGLQNVGDIVDALASHGVTDQSV